MPQNYTNREIEALTGVPKTTAGEIVNMIGGNRSNLDLIRKKYEQRCLKNGFEPKPDPRQAELTRKINDDLAQVGLETAPFTAHKPEPEPRKRYVSRVPFPDTSELFSTTATPAIPAPQVEAEPPQIKYPPRPLEARREPTYVSMNAEPTPQFTYEDSRNDYLIRQLPQLLRTLSAVALNICGVFFLIVFLCHSLFPETKIQTSDPFITKDVIVYPQ